MGDAGHSVVTMAARAGRWDVVTGLVEQYDADVDEPDAEGCTLLHDAARLGLVEVVAVLLECVPPRLPCY